MTDEVEDALRVGGGHLETRAYLLIQISSGFADLSVLSRVVWLAWFWWKEDVQAGLFKKKNYTC